MNRPLTALGTLFEALLPLHVGPGPAGYVVLRDRESRDEVSLEVAGGRVHAVPSREPGKKTLLTLDGSIAALKTAFSGGLAGAIDRREIFVSGDASFLESLRGEA
jgi:hypothetical protein